MAGINPHRIGQDEQFFPDAVEQLLVIPAGQVGSPNASAKQHIPSNQEGLLFTIETNMPG